MFQCFLSDFARAKFDWTEAVVEMLHFVIFCD